MCAVKLSFSAFSLIPWEHPLAVFAQPPGLALGAGLLVHRGEAACLSKSASWYPAIAQQ